MLTDKPQIFVVKTIPNDRSLKRRDIMQLIEWEVKEIQKMLEGAGQIRIQLV